MPGPARRHTTGMVSVKKAGNAQNAIGAPREINDHRIAASGIAISTNAPPISPVMTALLIRRAFGFGDKSIATRSSSTLPPSAVARRALDDRACDKVDRDCDDEQCHRKADQRRSMEDRKSVV